MWLSFNLLPPLWGVVDLVTRQQRTCQLSTHHKRDRWEPDLQFMTVLLLAALGIVSSPDRPVDAFGL